VILDPDGAFHIRDAADSINPGVTMDGQFTITAAELQITASGTQESSLIGGLGAIFGGGTPPPAPSLGGTMSCTAILTRASLTFQDAAGGRTMFVRPPP
jgi:hypothetical protein